MKAIDAFSALTDPANRNVARQTIPEGLWVSEVIARLSKATGVAARRLPGRAQGPGGPRPARRRPGPRRGLPLPLELRVRQEHPGRGPAQADGRDDPRRAQEGRASSPRTTRRILTVASIIEGEVNGDADRAKVARVIENRLADPNGPTVGLLQMDSTVHYIEQKRGRAGTSDAARASSSPYNTYRVKGLPPGPDQQPRAPPRSRPRPSPPTGRGSSSSPSTPTPARRSSPRPRPSTTATSRSSTLVLGRTRTSAEGGRPRVAGRALALTSPAHDGVCRRSD